MQRFGLRKGPAHWNAKKASVVSEQEPGIKGGWRGEEGPDYTGFVGHKMEFGLFPKIIVKLLRHFKSTDLV